MSTFQESLDAAVASASGAAKAAAASAQSAQDAANLVGAPADTAMAAAVSDSASATSGAVDTRIGSKAASWAAARPGNKCVWLGDSLTQWQDAYLTSGIYQRTSLANFASILSGQRIRYARNAGIGGNTTAQMLARFDSDVTPYSPNVVHLLGGTNDTSSTVADTLTNIDTIVGKIRAIGATPVLGTPPPKTGATTAERTRLASLAAGIKRYAESNGIALVDYNRLLVDPSTGGILAAYDNDGTHPNVSGFMAMGKLCSDTISPLLPAWVPPLAAENADPNNLITNGLFLTSGATGTGRANWTGGTGTGATSSVVTGDTAIQGNWLKWDLSATTATVQCYQNLAAPVAGHRYLLTGRVKTSYTSGADLFQIRNRITAGSAYDVGPIYNVSATITDGIFYSEYVCPSSATAQQVSVLINSGATGSIQVAQMTLLDLTAMGI